jgi:hypothetical protein
MKPFAKYFFEVVGSREGLVACEALQQPSKVLASSVADSTDSEEQSCQLQRIIAQALGLAVKHVLWYQFRMTLQPSQEA